MALLRQSHPDHRAAIAVLEQAPDAEKASLLAKARRLIIVANSNTALPTCLQGRLARGQPLPRVALVPTMGGLNGGGEFSNLRSMVGPLLGIEGMPGGEAPPRRVFGTVMDLVMPSWDTVLQDAGVLQG